ncbi:N(2)-acetyl-L-2,4-diaminobutanoate deacetylase DoeB2 [Methyloligella sp. 2.7D]|uniref:N(2)-acetyl-L-2,4-diaminobutanoate deacetylase DoeB2 n=1 Tax=unclassified Methyloligella TaxID=2625955 RepID=UPI00157CC236|nr:N(2)-acetyl-L-2,4-diaminobutanoate deacetylase DoeB2 [Methyloligella sp. GL2]QKP78091.1 amidohydrolase [Methyloligella sp. GL2]
MSVLSVPVGFGSTGESWEDLIGEAISLRRHLHRYPELTWQEEETALFIRKCLDLLDIPWRECARTGTVAILAKDAPGRHIALRGDIDALPIPEKGQHDWVSTRDGKMHACGHDGHTATLLAAGAWLKQHEDKLPGPVTLLFQPAEEGGHGAKAMIEDGALEGVDVVFGWHNWPAIPFDHAVCPDGPVMAGNATFRITLGGVGGHASQPESCRDPVLAASAITLNLQQIVSRRLPPQHEAVVSVTSIEAPSLATVIPEKAVIGGSIRFARSADRDVIFGLIDEIASDTARSYGVEATVEPFTRYDATVNHPAAAAEMREALAEELGEPWQAAIPLPIMASEDFSYYLQARPGAFALIGADDGAGHAHPCHSPYYDFNDRLIPVVARLYARLAGVPLTGTSDSPSSRAQAEA